MPFYCDIYADGTKATDGETAGVLVQIKRVAPDSTVFFTAMHFSETHK